MTDYYPLIARAVAGLEKNTGEARRSLYERARNALVDQLRGLNPPLAESEITRERLALEESIRKVEAEAARRPRLELPRSSPTVAAKPADRAPREPASDPLEQANAPAPKASPPAPDGAAAETGDQPKPPAPPPLPSEPASQRNARPRAALAGAGLKGFRDVVAEAETLGEATAQAARSARQAYAAVPSDAPELDRIEPTIDRIEPRELRPPPREPPVRPAKRVARGNGLSVDDGEPLPRVIEPRPMPPRPPDPRDEPAPAPAAPSRGPLPRGLIAAATAVLVLNGRGATLYFQRDRIKSLMVRSPSPSTQQPAAQPQPPQIKIPDRVGQSTEAPASGQASPDQSVAAVAQRVVLYEEDPSDPQGKRYVGSVIWKTEKVTPGPGQPPELAVRADLEIPERRINMTMSVRRNSDKALPASHTIEIMFNLPPDFPFGGISNVPGILMKQAEQTRGAPLAGLAVKVTSGFFLVGLSSAEADVQRNLQLLKERSWFDIPVVYNNGRRAILAVEKGTPGERAFNEAFAAWGG